MSRIAKWVLRHFSQDGCPWNAQFARAVPNESPFAPRTVLVGKDARALARELLGMTRGEVSAAFKSSPMKRAKLRGRERDGRCTPSATDGHRALVPGDVQPYFSLCTSL